LQWIVTWFICLSILLYIGRECVLLYIARSKHHGMLLETPSNDHYFNQIPPVIRTLDIVLTTFIGSTIVLYIIYMYDKLSSATTIHELSVIDMGIALLLYILYPSRTISHFINDKGLQHREDVTRWDNIYLVNIGKQAPARRMSYVQFKARGKSIEGYIHDRDIQYLQKQLASHSILLKEVVIDIRGRN